jgi:hypothetical protein
MSRAVILPTPGNPFLISWWLRHYEAHIAPCVDKLYVAVTWPTTEEVLDRIREDVHAAGGVMVNDRHWEGRHDHGEGLEWLIRAVEEDYILMAEDDWYVLDPEPLKALFAIVETGVVGVVGSPRANGSKEISDAMVEQGMGLWPHLIICKTEDLQAVKQRWGSVTWNPGEPVIGLDLVCTEVNTSDTAIAATLELRRDRAVMEVASPSRIQWDGDPWIHIGSLSSGPFDAAPMLAHADPYGWRIRTAWWKRTLDEWPGGLEEEHTRYLAAVDEIYQAIGPDSVNREYLSQAPIVNW